MSGVDLGVGTSKLFAFSSGVNDETIFILIALVFYVEGFVIK